jgi:UrcA family protein
MRIRATILAIAALSGAGAIPAHAENDFQQVTRPVSYSDLNLRAAAGRAELQARIEAAARRACSQNVSRMQNEVAHSRACYSDAVAAATQQATAIAG